MTLTLTQATADFMKRIQNYESDYERLDDKEAASGRALTTLVPRFHSASSGWALTRHCGSGK